MQIARIDIVEIDKSDAADAGSGEVESDRTSQPARADDEHRSGLQFLLPCLTNLGEDEVACVTGPFGFGQHGHLLSRARLAAYFAKLWSAVAAEPPLWECGGR